jgi:hypothetical protein
MGEVVLPLAAILSSLIVASAIVYASRTIASAVARQPANERPDGISAFSSAVSPQSTAGFPVEPSGVRVELETPLEVGSSVLAFSQARWWRAEVTALEGEEQVRIHFAGWDSSWDESVSKDSLQVDLGSGADDRPSYSDE